MIWPHPDLARRAHMARRTLNSNCPRSRLNRQGKEEKSPTGSFKFDGAVLELGGFVDFENIFRTTNTQNNIATAFGSIPFSNTPQGQITEFRTTAQYSRFNVKFTGNFEGNQITAYLETDFSGNDAPNVYQTVNSTTQRLRLYFADVKRGKWEFLGGQTWSWLTPNRNGLGPMPNDLAITYNEDQNLMVGVPYTRAAEFRAAYHPNEHWAMGVGIEDPNQYIGNYVALPIGFTSIGSQFDNNANPGAANLMPDILSKVTYDRDFSGRHFHAELTGLLTGAHATVMPVGSTAFRTHSVVGGGGQIAANYELVPKKLVVLANAFWSDGGAHYLVATGPQLVVRPNLAGTDVSLSMVHAGAGSAGLEWRATPKTCVRRLLRRGLFRTKLLSRHYRYYASRKNHRFWRTRFPQHQQPSYPAGHVRLDQYLLEEPQARSAAGLHTVFLLDSRPLVCSSRDAQECAFKHGLRGTPLRSADDLRNAGPSTSSGLKRRHVDTQQMAVGIAASSFTLCSTGRQLCSRTERTRFAWSSVAFAC